MPLVDYVEEGEYPLTLKLQPRGKETDGPISGELDVLLVGMLPWSILPRLCEVI